MIPEGVMAEARRVAEATMTQDVEVWRRTYRRTPGGEIVQDQEPTRVAVAKGRLSQLTWRESMIAGQLSDDVEGVLRLPLGVEVRGNDELVVDGRAYVAVLTIPQNADTAAQVKVLVNSAG